jgi:hypothetical protein
MSSPGPPPSPFARLHHAITGRRRGTRTASTVSAANAEVLHEPRLWPEYHDTYYGASVHDPDGDNVEAVCHAPEWTPQGKKAGFIARRASSASVKTGAVSTGTGLSCGLLTYGVSATQICHPSR